MEQNLDELMHAQYKNKLGFARSISLRQQVEVNSTHCESGKSGKIQ